MSLAILFGRSNNIFYYSMLISNFFKRLYDLKNNL